ncbi:N-glycosylase/DNA lyase [uncultured archaeon]|nr:N-glycosylase/DNA lyase [uncultured archaeon]
MKLVNKIENLKKEPIEKTIRNRVKEFEQILKEKDKEKIFSELCFCLMTANWQAQKAIELQKELAQDFIKANKETLAKKLKEKGHRFWPQRAEAIIKAREHKNTIHELVLKEKDEKKIREWIAENIRGLGMKESSHFLRNIGYKNLAIIDFHIVDLLVAENIIEQPKTITKKKYLEIENKLEEISKKTKIPQGELDLYLWYLETGKVLK